MYNTPKEILPAISKAAIQKDSYSLDKQLLLGFFGGAYVAFGSVLALVVGGGMPGIAAENPGLVKFAFGAVFPIGLILVIVAGAELFTSSTAIMTVSVLNKERSMKSLLKVWTVGYLSNFVGAVFVAYFLGYHTGLLTSGPFADSAINIAVAKTSNPFFKTFVKGIGANWLVCLAAWQAYAAKDITGKVLGIWFPVMTFVAFGFEHCIANMFFVPMGMLLGADISWSQFITANLIPATLGNIVGGALFVGAAYWYIYVKPDKKKTDNMPVEEMEKELVNV
ncbi:formate/nitrite transporter family protein [Limibacter armeniacum]|uniref:formate/nitrite transporter family protein n=1 Tax=Limibacter armeniacum TaxID=466084 RepID=UPI002FE59C03